MPGSVLLAIFLREKKIYSEMRVAKQEEMVSFFPSSP